MSLIHTFSERQVEYIEELSKGLIIFIRKLKLIPINSCEGEILEKNNQDWDAKRVDVCFF